MAVFRIEKTRDYTVMSNHHLRNTDLSLEAKGLLSLMLSLPDGWDYTTKGLGHFLNIRGVGVNDISVDRHLAEVGAVPLRGELLHFLVNQPLFILRDPKFHLDISFAVCQAIPTFHKGLGYPNKQFSFGGRGTPKWSKIRK